MEFTKARCKRLVERFKLVNLLLTTPTKISNNFIKVGIVNMRNEVTKHSIDVDYKLVAKLAGVLPKIAEYTVPQMGSYNEKLFLKNSDSRKQRIESQEWARAPALLYEHAPLKTFQMFEGPVLPTYVFFGLLTTVNPDANPGVPELMLNQTKKQVMSNPVPLYGAVAERLLLLSSVPNFVIKMFNPVDIVQLLLADPFKASVKKEAIRGVKLAENRGRVFEMASIVDELVSKAITYNTAKVVLATPGQHFSLLGMPLSGQEPLDFHSRIIEVQQQGDLASSDMDGFEFSIPEVAFEACADYDIKVGQIDEPKANALRNYAVTLARGLICFSDGEVWMQTSYGWMKSGVSLTADWDTKVRSMLELLAGPGFVYSSADDCISKRRSGALVFFYRLGFVPEDYEKDTTEGFECCSHLWVDGFSPYPVRLAKATFNLLLDGITPQKLHSYIEKFYKVENFSEVLAVLVSDIQESGT